MKKLEVVFGFIVAAGFAGTALLAIMVMGTLIYKSVFAVALPVETISVTTQKQQSPNNDAAVAAPVAVEVPGAVTAATHLVSTKKGAAVFKKCKACHTIENGGKNGIGPNLWSIVGKPVAATDGFAYSKAMAAFSGQVWDLEFLDSYLTKPKDALPGNKMSFAGLSNLTDRQNVITYLAQYSNAPKNPTELGFIDAVEAVEVSSSGEAAEVAEIESAPYPDGVDYRDPPSRSPAETEIVAGAVAALEKLAPLLEYDRARYHPLHFPPMIGKASNEECLVCHQEILDHKPRAASPANVPADATIAWYQTMDTYSGDQESFHWRHLESDFAKQVMRLECTFCHKGNDPREENPDMMPNRAAFSAPVVPEFTLRKTVNPSKTCLLCHGAMSDPERIMGLGGPWHEVRSDMEDESNPNGCLSCHAELYRTARHNVSYLKAASIEKAAREGTSDTCYGCHGGRQWYRISYPYSRHAWPDMDPEIPDWAAERPTLSDPEYALPPIAEK